MIHEIIFPSLISLLVLGPGFLITVEGLHCYSCDQNSVLGVPDTCGDLATPTSQNTTASSFSSWLIECVNVHQCKFRENRKLFIVSAIQSFSLDCYNEMFK